MKKKVLIFSVAYLPFVGGAEVAVKEITDRISDLEFHMITLNLDGKQKSEEHIGNIKIYRIGWPGRISKLLFPFAASHYALKLHAREKFDVIWSIMASFSGFAALFFKLRRPQVPFLLTLQEGDPFTYIKRQVWFIYPLYKQIFTKADRIQTISTYLKDIAVKMGSKAPIEVIPNGVDLELFSKEISDAELDQIRTETGKEKGDRILITTSRLVIKNGIGDLISALIHLPHSMKLVIIGSGSLEQKLQQQVETLKLKSRVVFLGQKEYKDIPKYLAASDVFVRPSLSEGMGNSFIEAMAARLPIVATAVGGIPDFLKEGQTGLFCEPHNPKSIAEAVQKILEHQELRNNLVHQAQNFIREKYEWNHIASHMNTLFNKLTDRVV